jgi:hypothetical protein
MQINSVEANSSKDHVQNNQSKMDWNVAQAAQRLLCKLEALSSNSNLTK